MKRLVIVCAFMLTFCIPTLGQYRFGEIQSAAIENPTAIAAGQECPMFCWAASIQMGAASQGIELAQTAIFQKVFGPYVRCLPSGNIENIVTGINGVYRRSDGKIVTLRARAFYGNNGYAGPLIKAILDDRPFIFLTQTHAMVAVGVSWSEVFDRFNRLIGVQIWSIDLIDPYFTFGAQKYVTFPIRADTVNNISGAIEIYSFEVSR